MRPPLRIVFALSLALAGGTSAAAPTEPPGAAQRQADWRSEFDEVCAKTQDAMALPLDELRTLIERCDRLVPALESLGESERKVFARRLRGCRDLYAYVLASRQENR